MNAKIKSWLSWSYDHSNSKHIKYSTPAHPLFIALTGTLLYILISLLIRYNFYGDSLQPLHSSAPYIGVFLLVYLAFMITSRYLQNGSPAIYETLWACNQSILLSAIGCLTGDSFLIRTTLVVVSVDQLLWYIDMAGFMIKRKFYVGVAKYIIWPQTSKIRLSTTFHHIWFFPLCLFIIHPSAQYTTFNVDIYILSCILSLLLAIIGRISAPKEIEIIKPGQKSLIIYMNLNLSWQLWKDIKIGLFEYLYRILPPLATIILLSIIWDLGNIPGFLLFWGLQSITK